MKCDELDEKERLRREKNRNRVAEWRKRNLEKYNANKKAYREKTKAERKKWAQDYYEKNKVELLKKAKEYHALHPEVKRNASKKRRGKDIVRAKNDRLEMRDHYIADLIKGKSKMSKKELRQNQELIEVYKANLLLKRAIKNYGKE